MNNLGGQASFFLAIRFLFIVFYDAHVQAVGYHDLVRLPRNSEVLILHQLVSKRLHISQICNWGWEYFSEFRYCMGLWLRLEWETGLSPPHHTTLFRNLFWVSATKHVFSADHVHAMLLYKVY